MVTLKNPKQVREENVSLSTLKSLQSASFLGELPEHATRDVKPEHVSNLCNAIALTADNVVTPFTALEVVNTDEGLFIIDGNHRREAIERYLRMVVLQLANNDTLTPLALGRALKQELDEKLQKQLDELRATVKVPVKVGIYKDLNEVAKFALTANIQEGLHLQPDNKSRSVMGAEYYNLLITMGQDSDGTPLNGKKPNQAAIARLFSVGRSSLNEYLREKGLGVDTHKEETTDTPSDTDKEPTEKQEETAEQKFCAKLASALKMLDKVDDLLPYIQQMKQSLTAKQISVLVELASEKGGKHTPTTQTTQTPKQSTKASSKAKPASKGPVTLDSKDSQVTANEDAIA